MVAKYVLDFSEQLVGYSQSKSRFYIVDKTLYTSRRAVKQVTLSTLDGSYRQM